MPTRMQADRLIAAVLANLDIWIEDGTAGIDADNPRLGLMHLTRNMMMCRISLRRLAGDPDAEDDMER